MPVPPRETLDCVPMSTAAGPPPSSSRRSAARGSGGRRALGLFLVVLAAAPLLALAEGGIRRLYARWLAPTGDARWIWIDRGEANEEGGVDFFAVRDVELAGYPARARIACQADEEYFLYLNGTLVGSGRHRDGRPLDAYEVGYLLEPGSNRIALELRSGRGEGGLLFDLRLEGDESRRLGSDADWRIVRGYSDEMLLPGEPLPDSEEPLVLGRPPVGRWDLPRIDAATPVFGDLLLDPAGRHAPWAHTGGRIVSVTPPDWSSPPLGRRVTFDWGREFEGYLNLVFALKGGARALVFVGTTLPDPEHDPPAASLLNPPGRRSWSDSRPRRFRYVTVIATDELAGARVYPLAPELAAGLLAEAEAPQGVFGLEPLPLRPPVEKEIRREIEGLPGVSPGQGL